MNATSEQGWHQLLRCRLAAEAERYALVLAAMGISSRLEPDGEGVLLLVRAADAARAQREIAAYVRENLRQSPPPPLARPLAEGLQGVAAYVAVLLFLHTASLRDAFGHDWLGAGMAQAGRILGGEWWRVVTALGLHADGAHLLGNLAFGSLFGLLLAQLIGGGLAWLAILLAGAFGNLLAAALHGAGHSSIGASTAVFAALGLLSALSWRQQAPARLRGLRRWGPLAAGVMLLAYLGVGGERTDVLAHVTGFAAGILGGLGLAALRGRVPTGPGAQLAYAVAAVAILVLAWLTALSAAG